MREEEDEEEREPEYVGDPANLEVSIQLLFFLNFSSGYPADESCCCLSFASSLVRDYSNTEKNPSTCLSSPPSAVHSAHKSESETLRDN